MTPGTERADGRDGGSPQVLVLAAGSSPQVCRLAGEVSHAVVVRPSDLSRPGWTYRDDCGAVGYAWSGGSAGAATLRHVVVLLTHVHPIDLPHIDPRDRGYVAEEMTAFLRVWLDGLGCTRWNQPSDSSLAGDVLALGRPRPAGATHPVVVVQGAAVGAPGPRARRAESVARSLGRRLVRVELDGADRPVSVGPVLDVGEPGVAAALIRATAS